MKKQQLGGRRRIIALLPKLGTDEIAYINLSIGLYSTHLAILQCRIAALLPFF